MKGKAIRLRGVRQNNLKNFDLDIPLHQLTVITGLSGSGKSSLAFDTLFAEGQRRYIETFSPYARQFFDRMDKPQVDRIEGIPPAGAIEQKNPVKSTRSTVGTMTEICDYMKDLWGHVARPFCPECGRVIQADSPEGVARLVSEPGGGVSVVLVLFEVAISEALGVEECLRSLIGQGFQRCWFRSEVWKIEALMAALGKEPLESVELKSLEVIQDRVRLGARSGARSRARLVEACEQAFVFGRERLRVLGQTESGEMKELGRFSRALECSACQVRVARPSRGFFSFNSPVGACPVCRGFGRVIGIDYPRTIPDRSLSLAGGVVKLWRSGHGLRSQRDLMKMARKEGIPTWIPFQELTSTQQQWVLYGSPGYGTSAGSSWPHAWYGLKGYFDWLESKAYKMHYRVLLARYRAYYECHECRGTRFKPEVLAFRMHPESVEGETGSAISEGSLHLADVYRLPVKEVLGHVSEWSERFRFPRSSPAAFALEEVRSRLHYMVEVGLGYLTLDRPTRTLSGGETERINLTSCLGTRLVNTLFVLDEPSVGLHATDVRNLIGILQRLRDAGNTVVVVEHDEAIIRAADRVIDIGPRSGAQGGELIYAGSVAGLRRCRRSLTARYLSGEQKISRAAAPDGTGSEATRWLEVSEATCHNLDRIAVRIPLNRLVCISGVSGSGKTTLVKEVLVPELERRRSSNTEVATESGGEPGDSPDLGGMPSEGRGTATLRGHDALDSVVMVAQSPVGKTPRSNPVVYIGVFEAIRKWFASSREARAAGLTPGAFSFNSAAGQCERCRGAGYEKIEMQFLSDVFVECPDCAGTRYRRELREFRIDPGQFDGDERTEAGRSPLSIVDYLRLTVDEAVGLVRGTGNSQARRALSGLAWLQAAGLGYLSLGQPLNTLSGGEAQRLKVVRHLASSGKVVPDEGGRTLFVFDEPTTGLHFADIEVLLAMFRQMVRAGHSLLIVEHHLDVLGSADWIVDLGPGAGIDGGVVVYQGHPAGMGSARDSITATLLAGTAKTG